MRYVFYDTETTGTDTVYDQILQFAAILTDEDLKELERFEIRCRILPHIVPAPGALNATRVSPAMLTDSRFPSHYDAVCAIAKKLTDWSPAIFLGYNSIEFDEPLLRQSFYQTLHPIYVTNTNGNRRGDVLRLVQAATTLFPGSVVLPVGQNGKPTRKLDTIAPANGFNHSNAHDALADVEATIFMARLVKERAPQIWDEVMPLVDKQNVLSRLSSNEVLCLTEVFGANACNRIVFGCGHVPGKDSLACVFDLQYDPNDYLSLAEDELISVMLSRRKALRYVAANKQPILSSAENSRLQNCDIKISWLEIDQRAKMLANSPTFLERVRRALARRFSTEREPAIHVEGKIYDGFATRRDSVLLERFHQVPWQARQNIIEEISDPRFRELGYRLIYFNEPNLLPTTIRNRFDAWRVGRLMGGENEAASRTIIEAIAEADELLALSQNISRSTNDELKSWLLGLSKCETEDRRVGTDVAVNVAL